MSSLNLKYIAVLLVALAVTVVALAQSKSGSGFNVSRMDKTASACTDFYQYANGNWLKTTEIPSAFSSWGSFNVLAENNRKVLHDILEESARNANANKGSVEQKIGDFYASCMDEAKREAEGSKPLVPELARIDKIKTPGELQAEIAYLHRRNIPALFASVRCPI